MGILSALSSPRPAGTPAGSATQITTTQLPPEFRPFITDIFEKAKAQQEGLKYIPFTGPRIRSFGPLQEEAFTGLTQLARQGVGTLPDATSATFLTGAREAAARAGRPITAEDIQRLSSPFQQEVIDVAKREAQRDFDLQVAPKVAAEAAAAGSFGGSRAGLIEAESLRNLQEQLSDIQTKGSSQAFSQAQKAFQDERAAAAGLSGFLERQMTGVPNQALKELATLQTVGESKQALDQQALNLAYQDFLEEREFPTRSLQEYQASIRGFPYTPAAYQYTTQTTPTPTLGQTLLTTAAQGAGLYGALGGFGFGQPTQRAASGGQIRGGLGGLVESHQDIRETYPVDPRVADPTGTEASVGQQGSPLRIGGNTIGELLKMLYSQYVPDDTVKQTPWYSGIVRQAATPTTTTGADAALPVPVSAVAPVPATNAALPVPATTTTAPAPPVVPAHVSALAVPPATTASVAAEINPMVNLRGLISSAKSPDEAFKAYIASFSPVIKATEAAQIPAIEADRLAGLAAKTRKEAAVKGVDARSKLREEDLTRLQKRMKDRTTRYGTEKGKLEGFGEDIRRQGEEALEAEKEAGERLQEMHRDERQSLREQERFEIFAGFGSVGGITEEEAALGQAVPMQGFLTTLGRIASEVTKSIKQPLRDIKEKERKSYKAEVKDSLFSGKEYRRLERAATLEDRNSFKELSQFSTDYENNLTQFYTAERTLRELQTTEAEQRAKAELDMIIAQGAVAGREAARKNVIAKLTQQMHEGATKVKRDQATYLLSLYKELPDLSPDTVEAADYNVLLKQVSGATPGRFTIVDGQLRNLDGSAFDADTETKHADAYTNAMRVLQVTGNMPLAVEAYIEKARASGIVQPSAVSSVSSGRQRLIDDFSKQTYEGQQDTLNNLRKAGQPVDFLLGIAKVK